MLLRMGHDCAGICRHSRGVCVQLSTQLGFRFPNVQGILQSHAQSVRAHARSRLSLLDQAAQRGSCGALLWRSAAQGICCGDWRGRHGQDPVCFAACCDCCKRAKTWLTPISSTAGSLPRNSCSTFSADFGLPASGKNKGELLLDLSRFLVSRGSKKLTTVLILDEAHHLSADILEEVRLLTNLETAEDQAAANCIGGSAGTR